MEKGSYQNNGASPWYAVATLGTPPQRLKLAIDTGTNIIWSTSSLCSPTGCRHDAGGRFGWERSSSFSWVDRDRIPYSFGPWGQMQVETGADRLSIPGRPALPVDFYLAAQYDSPQFAQLGWDGGIGLPSGSAYVQKNNSFIVERLMNLGHISLAMPFVSFHWDAESRQGHCEIGGFDRSRYLEAEGIFMPWTPYTKLDGAQYLWTTPLESYRVGSRSLGNDLQFALDSGSSEFKGDDAVMNDTLQALAQCGYPPVVLGLDGGEISISRDQYMVTIEAGPSRGQTLPQFNALGAKDLVLVGSVLMEHCYVIHQYRVARDRTGRYTLLPFGMYAFNRPGGPKLITRPSKPRTPSRGLGPLDSRGHFQ